MSKTPKIVCPSCHNADLEQHKRDADLLVCPLCWHKYEKEPALKGEFILVKAKPKKMGFAKKYRHPY